MLQYHFRTKEGPSLGPIGDAEFRQRHEAGEIDEETMVWRSGMLDWTTFGQLRAHDARATQPRSAEPPPLPVRALHTSRIPVFLACSGCAQEWPEHLMLPSGSKKICGNCHRQQKEELKKRGLQNNSSGVSSGWGKWLLKVVVLAIVFGGLLFLRVWMKTRTLEGARMLPRPAEASRHLGQPALR